MSIKIKHKKLLASGIAVAMTGILGVGALLQSSISVQASPDMMPGIEEIVNNTSSSDEPFQILEIVDEKSEAEIGYYISGQEPYIKLYEYSYTDDEGETQTITFKNLDDGLSKLPENKRKEFAANVKISEDGSISTNGTNIKNIQNISYQDGISQGNEEDYPLSYTEYQEKYFLSDAEKEDTGWKKIDFVDSNGNPRTDTMKMNGEYKENTSGTGNYTKQEQTYYPIRNGVSEDNAKTDKYRENIENFYYSDDETAQAPYFLEFEAVKNDTVNEALSEDDKNRTIQSEYDYTNGRYGYYENAYTDLTSEIVQNIEAGIYKFPGENPKIPDNSVELQTYISTHSDAFSAGTEEEFSSVENSSSTVDQPAADFTGGQDDEFTGDAFSSGAESEMADSQADLIPDNSDNTANIDGESSQSDVVIEDNNSTEQLILGEVRNAESQNQNFQANPNIYLGENIDAYPYYKYTLVGDLTYVKHIADSNADKDAQAQKNGAAIVRADKDITLEDGQYWYWMQNQDGNLSKMPLSIVTGRQPVPYSDVKKIDSRIVADYYYRVKQVYFCCAAKDAAEKPEDFQYFGWYYSSYPQNQDIYIKVTEDDTEHTATHYISDAEYKLTPGTGNFDFIMGGDKEQAVQVDHMYYKGGYVNHDWFKQFVFHLSPEDKLFQSFDIEVTTITTEEFNQAYGNGVAVTSTDEVAIATDSSENNTDEISDSDIQKDADTDVSNTTDNETVQEDDNIEDSETSEVESMVSEAGVELVSIEKEFNDNNTEKFQDGEENLSEFTDTPGETASAFSAGLQSSVNTENHLSQYNLIYVNGQINSVAAQAIKGIATIVNAAKVTDGSQLENSFNEYIVEEDADGHYVNTDVYFFKNTLATGTEDAAGLVNLEFHTNFNENLESEEEISYGGSDLMQGFEEIVKYINSENRYRQLDASGNGTAAVSTVNDNSEKFSSGEKENSENATEFSSNAESQSINPLNRKISQARAIEYIINYKYKRTARTKNDLKVLEIMPDVNCKQLTDDKVKSWVYGTENTGITNIAIEKIEAKCSQSGFDTDKINSDTGTWWHSQYNTYSHGTDPHYLIITLKQSSDVNGFLYQSRSDKADGHENGTMKSYKAEFFNEKGKLLGTSKGNDVVSASGTGSSPKTIMFEKTFSNVKKVVLYFTETYAKDSQNQNKYAHCVDLGIIYDSASVNGNVTRTTMTASEFVGHIDDIASEYDIIYIGDKILTKEYKAGTNGLNTQNLSSPLITGIGDYRYVHVGDGVKATEGTEHLLKLLGQLDNEYDYNSDGTLWSQKGYWTDPRGRGVQWHPDSNGTTTINRFAPFNTYGPNSGGYFRGSGNDITKQQYEELLDFVKSGYPVILGAKLVTSDRTANDKTVDSASWYYQFINEALKFNNVVTDEELENKDKDISFYTNLAKPVITFDEDDGMPPEPPRMIKKQNGSFGYESITEERDYIDGELKFKFTVTNDSDAAPAVTTYDCNLYIDLNFDGNLSEKEVQDNYIQIQDSDGNVISQVEDGSGKQRYELKPGKQYTLIRKIPKDYYKVITWKLEISSNRNSYIHTSVMGYAKQHNSDPNAKQNINVLQLIPNKNSHWDLSQDSTFGKMISQIEDFRINIITKTVTEINDSYDEKSMENLLADKQMLILGFADVYQDISDEKGQVQAIRKFIQDGKSIIFAHDTTSYVNYSRDGIYNKIASTEYGKDENTNRFYDDWLFNTAVNPTWGLSLNKVLRSIVGMDRYGITSTKTFENGMQVGELLRKGNALTDGSDSVSFAELMKLAGDIAYQNDSGKQSSYGQTQAYSNTVINQIQTNENNASVTKRAAKINDGAITQYPYCMGNEAISISPTHGQYYQLALEQDQDINGNSDGKNDIVVWYCLTDGYYSNSPNDVRNNYYFYSKGNVIYTGAGHKDVTEEQEIKLFINAIVAAANVTAVEPDVHFVKSLNPAAETENTRYYMTDQSVWSKDNMLENDMELYFNVKDYNMVSADLNQKDLDKQEMTVKLYIEDADGTELTGEGIPTVMQGKKLKDITAEIAKLKEYDRNPDKIKTVSLGEDNQFHLKKNNAYAFSLANIDDYLQDKNNSSYYSNKQVYVMVTSTVYLYGQDKSTSSAAVIDLRQRQLFDMD